MTRNKCNLETEYKLTTADKIGIICGAIIAIIIYSYIFGGL
jgi:hypothetical protein